MTPAAIPSPAAADSGVTRPAPGMPASTPGAASCPPRPVPLAVGDTIGERRVPLTRQDLVRYAGASGDLNPIHYSDQAAEAAGLPGVIAHGMLTMGIAAQLLVNWADDPGAILDYEVRFARPVRVPYPGATDLAVSGIVASLDPQSRTAGILLTVTQDGVKVLGKAKATVRLPA